VPFGLGVLLSYYVSVLLVDCCDSITAYCLTCAQIILNKNKQINKTSWRLVVRQEVSRRILQQALSMLIDSTCNTNHGLLNAIIKESMHKQSRRLPVQQRIKYKVCVCCFVYCTSADIRQNQLHRVICICQSKSSPFCSAWRPGTVLAPEL